jgi:hypothetical protein
MLLKRSLMARCVVALTALAFATSAAPKDDKKKKEDKAGTTMEEGGKDPAQTETFEAGQFVPGKKREKEATPCDEGDEECEEEAAKAEEGKAKEAEPKKPYKAKKTVGVFAEALIGFGKAPEPGPIGSNSTGDATSFGFLLGGHYDISSPFRLMLRVPVTTGTVKTSTNLDARETALGAPELAGRLRLGDPGETEWAIKLAVGVPVAQGNPDVSDTADARGFTQARLQRVANAANGWHDPELYAMKRLPISPALQFLYRTTKLRLNGELKAVFLPKIGGGLSASAATYKGGSLEVNGLGVWAILGGSVSYEILTRKLFGALAAWATYEIAHDYTWEGGNPPSPFQFTMEPRVLAQFGKVVPSVGFLIPLGGQLGGNIYGLRLHVDVVF